MAEWNITKGGFETGGDAFAQNFSRASGIAVGSPSGAPEDNPNQSDPITAHPASKAPVVEEQIVEKQTPQMPESGTNKPQSFSSISNENGVGGHFGKMFSDPKSERTEIKYDRSKAGGTPMGTGGNSSSTRYNKEDLFENEAPKTKTVMSGKLHTEKPNLKGATFRDTTRKQEKERKKYGS